MRALSQSRTLRFLGFGLLYFAQGVPWGFISVGYVVFLADQGLGNEQVGWALGLAYLPWSFKVVFGPLVDRFPSARLGRRRPYILLAQALMGATLLLLLWPDPRTQLSLVAAILFVHNTFAALQDVAVDALAVDLLPREERASANSVMWAAKAAGVAAGGGAGTALARYIGWPGLFVTMTLLIWAVMLLPLLVRERTGPQAAGARLSAGELRRSFGFAAPLWGLAIALLTPLGYALPEVVYTRMLRAELHYSEGAIATLQGVLDPVAGVVGALVGGILADRLGVRRMVGVYMGAIALVLAAFGALPGAWDSFAFLAGYTVALKFLVSAYNAATLGFFMTLSNPAVGATQFAVFMAGTNLCYAIASPAGGRIADTLGYSPLYFVAAAVQLATVALLPLCNPREAEARFRRPPA